IAGPEAPDSVASCGFSGTLQQSSVPAIGPNGEVYVVWQFGPTFTDVTSTNAEIRVARSLNGGVSFNTSVTVASINSMRQNPPVGYNRNRINDHPRIAVATSGPRKGRVFVSFTSAVSPVSARSTVQSLVSSQVFVKFSDDRGLTWSSAVPVAPAPPSTGLKRWWPVVSFDPEGGVDVVYYESQEKSIGTTCNRGGRSGPAVSLVDTFLAQSQNGGATFGAPVKISSATSNWCTTVSNIQPNFGDYIGSGGTEERLFPVWADGRNGVPDTFAAPVKTD
ncbi:MAG TPA: hypothetical protein VLO07_09535, partial [Thermoanaerobaculia bacterium]|nr:hypothetical protein [Thermoanaerobaculia bacterium]